MSVDSPQAPPTNGHRAGADALPAHVDVAIVGSGFAGLGMAIKLKRLGRNDFVVLERADDVGGTWRDNTYPGCQCDVPSNLYSFSFAPNPDWSQTFAPQPEIEGYLRRCADEYGIRPRVRFGCELLDAAWDEPAQRWRLETSRGSMTARVLVSGMGGLSTPSIPKLPGIETFEGVAFHSAQWRHDHDLAGRRVAVVGTGASAIQIVPAIQPHVAHLDVFQRTPPWIMPHPSRPTRPAERRLFRRFPTLQLLARELVYWGRETFVLPFKFHRLSALPQRMALRHLERQVPDPELRRKLTPTYEIGCKRILLSDQWYPALQRPNVELVSERIAEVRPKGIVTADGRLHEIDTIVYGTGFAVLDMPAMSVVRGRDGRTLGETWDGSPQAHRGTECAGFPNLFILVGPNTGLGHNSIVFMIESQIAYVTGALEAMDRAGAGAVEPRADAQDAFNEAVQARTRGTVWTSGGCKSWYLDAKGRSTLLWPGSSWSFRQATRRFDPAEHVLHPRVGDPAAMPAAVC